MSTQPQAAESARPRWIPGEPYRPIAFHVLDAMRVRNLPANRAAEIACERRETQEEADGLACPVCPAPIGTRCFGPDARSNHPERGMAHWDARVAARNATCHWCGGLGYSEGYACTCAAAGSLAT